MYLSDISIKRPVFATMMIVALIVFGLLSYRELGIELFPKVDIPNVTIKSRIEGASLEEMEEEVTDVIEEAVNTIEGVKHLRSTTLEEISLVYVEFVLEKNVDIAVQEVRDKLDTIKDKLPDDMDPIIAEKLDPDASPIMSIIVSGNLPIRTLTHDIADDLIKTRIERLRGVGSVTIIGGREREIQAWVDRYQLLAYRLTPHQIARSLKRNHIELPVGRITGESSELSVRLMGEVSRVNELNDIIISRKPGGIIRFSDVGEIVDGLEEERSFSQLDGEKGVALFVRKQSGTNTVATIEKIKKELETLRKELPPGIRLTLVQDDSRFIKDAVHSVERNLIEGITLTVLIILFFLMSFRSTIICAISIPASIIASFIIFRPLGFSLNTLTLMALALVVGIVVDDAIIVIENTYRHLEEGKSPMEAARIGAREIGMAATVSTLSIAIVFSSLAFMKGMIGRWFFSFGMGIVITVMASLFVAFTVIPMLSSRFLSFSPKKRFPFNLIDLFLTYLQKGYKVILHWSIKHRSIVILGSMGVFYLSLKLAGIVGVEFVTTPDRSEFNILIDTPLSSSIERSKKSINTLEEEIRQIPEVAHTFSTIGGGTKEDIHKATIYVRLKDRWKRDLSQGDIMNKVRQILAAYPEITAAVEPVPPVPRPGEVREAQIQLLIKGPDLNRLIQYSETIMDRMRETPGIVDIDSSHESGKPEVRIHVDRERVAEMGADMAVVAETIQMLIGGIVVNHYTEGKDRYDVRLRLTRDQRLAPEDVLKLPIPLKDNQFCSLYHIADMERAGGPIEIRRHNRLRQITVYADLDGLLLGEALQKIGNYITELRLSSGYEAIFLGRAEQLAETKENLGLAMIIALIAIYMLLASQFESFIHPLTIMLTVPLTLIGAIGALFITGRTLNLMSMIGFLTLMGVVIKNGVLLIDYTNQLRWAGVDRDQAIVTAGPVRLRPILMTAISTIVGMLPVALSAGEGAEIRSPMAIVIMGGLATSTFLTLVVIPVIYSLFDDLGKLPSKIRNLPKRKQRGK